MSVPQQQQLAATLSPVALTSGEATYTPGERNRVIAAAGLGWGLEYFDLTLVALMAGAISKDFGVSLGAFGIVFTLQLIATAFGGLIFGRLADLHGRRRVLSWTIWVVGVSTALCALAPNLTVFALLRVVSGLGVGGEWAVGFALLNEAWSPKRRGLAGGSVQAAIWPAYAVAIFVTGAVGWRAAFLIGLVPVAAAIWVRRSCPESHQWQALQRGEGTAAVAGSQRSSLSDLFNRRNLAVMGFGTLVVFGAQYSYYVYSSWMPTYLKRDLGISASDAQLVLYCSAAIALVSYVSAGGLSDRWGRRRTLLCFATLQLAAFVAFAGLNAGHGPSGWIIASYFAISFGLGYFAIFGAWFGELFPTPVRATGSSFCYSVGRGFASFGPYLVGILASRYGLGGGISTGLLAVLLMMLFALFLPDRKGRVITAAE